MLYTVLTLTIPRFFVVCATGPNIQCLMLKAGVIHVYVAMRCKGLKLRNPARLHSNLYLETVSCGHERNSMDKAMPHPFRTPLHGILTLITLLSSNRCCSRNVDGQDHVITIANIKGFWCVAIRRKSNVNFLLTYNNRARSSRITQFEHLCGERNL